jgi:hypothetical protein
VVKARAARKPEVIHHSRMGGDIVSGVVTVGMLRLDPPGISIDVGEVCAAAG